ncbi:MAG: cobyrinate a,c-diamide synthase [Eubacterium sp.]
MEKKIQAAVAASSSNSGKTLISCGLLEILKRKGLNPCAFKTGPDYIDPMFHRSILNVSSHNLDLVMSDENYVRAAYSRELAMHGSSVIEGVMGMYDGLSGKTDTGSCWHLAGAVNVPVLLVLSPHGSSLTLAAEVKGLQNFRQDSHIAGIFLNRCKASYAALMKTILEQETGLPVIGFLPEIPDVRVKSRHLGLYQADEIEDLQKNIGIAADEMERHLDWDAFQRAFSVPAPQDKACPAQGETEALETAGGRSSFPSIPESPAPRRAVVAIARDEAFSFCYRETEEEMDRQGGYIVYFSPIHEPHIPEEADALYLPGGYPELYAKALSENQCMRESIREAVNSGMPVIAECGGFLYLLDSICDDKGQKYPMAGVFPGGSRNSGRLVRFGYAEMTAEEDNLLMKKGDSMYVHEFHYWGAEQDGEAFHLKKPLSSREWNEGYSGKTCYAAFPHLYLAAYPEAVDRYISAAEKFRRQKEEKKTEHK